MSRGNMEQVHGIEVITFSNHLLSSWFAALHWLKPELTSFGQFQYEITYRLDSSKLFGGGEVFSYLHYD